VLRSRNAGLTNYGAETFPATWPAIPEATWRAVVSILSNPAAAPAPATGLAPGVGRAVALCESGAGEIVDPGWSDRQG
jgi:hypothetical protein